MARHGEDITENENNMVIVVVLFPLFLWFGWMIFTNFGWSVTNYLGDETPYCLGLSALGAGIFILGSLNVELIIYLYLLILWITGFIDDRFGTKYPKGLKGHFKLFLQTGKISTGLYKLASTITVAGVFVIFFYNDQIWGRIATFLLLVLGPHIMNLFDTKPLRVWKVIGIQIIVFWPLFRQLQADFLFTIIFMSGLLIFFEGKKLGMLGDNGATLLGGMISLLAVFHLNVFLQWVVISVYCIIIFITERISLSAWIDKSPLLKRVDRWGVS